MRSSLGTTFAPGDATVSGLQPSPDWADALEAGAPGVTAVVAENQTSGETWINTLTRLLPVMATTYQQRQLLEIQTERARQGLPPLDASQYGVGVNVGLNPDTRKLLIYGGVAALALLAMASLRRR